MPGKDRESERDESYGRHARDVTGRHLAGACPECARVEELGRSASQLEKNCTALFEALRALHNKHGGCGCLECGAARFLIRVVERFGVEIGEPEAGPGAASADLGPDPRFEKIVSPNGYPVAQFYTRVMSTETPDPNRFLLDRDTVAGIVQRAAAEGRSVPQYERALKALDDAIAAWAQTPWDGR